LPVQIAKLCESKNLVIQAGGNAGLYPKQYSRLFESVVTLEPDHRNFTCLCHNVPEENVVKYQAAVGDVESSIELETNPRWNETNTGALKIKGHGNIKQITIDSLNDKPVLNFQYSSMNFVNPNINNLSRPRRPKSQNK
jgi:FkbM family methyltransferase